MPLKKRKRKGIVRNRPEYLIEVRKHWWSSPSSAIFWNIQNYCISFCRFQKYPTIKCSCASCSRGKVPVTTLQKYREYTTTITVGKQISFLDVSKAFEDFSQIVKEENSTHQELINYSWFPFTLITHIGCYLWIRPKSIPYVKIENIPPINPTYMYTCTRITLGIEPPTDHEYCNCTDCKYYSACFYIHPMTTLKQWGFPNLNWLKITQQHIVEAREALNRITPEKGTLRSLALKEFNKRFTQSGPLGCIIAKTKYIKDTIQRATYSVDNQNLIIASTEHLENDIEENIERERNPTFKLPSRAIENIPKWLENHLGCRFMEQIFYFETDKQVVVPGWASSVGFLG